MKKYIMLLILFISTFYAFSQPPFEEEKIMTIIFPTLKELGLEEYSIYRVWSKEKRSEITHIQINHYKGDSIYITPEDFPNLKKITINASCSIINLKGLSDFKNLESFSIITNDMFQSCYNSSVETYIPINLSEVWKLKELKELEIVTSPYFEISDSIIRLQKLEKLVLSQFINPELISQLKSLKEFKIQSYKAYNIILYRFLNNLTIKTDFGDIDTSLFQTKDLQKPNFKIVYTNGELACEGTLKNNKRVGTWQYNYYSEYGDTLFKTKKYDSLGVLRHVTDVWDYSDGEKRIIKKQYQRQDSIYTVNSQRQFFKKNSSDSTIYFKTITYYIDTTCNKGYYLINDTAQYSMNPERYLYYDFNTNTGYEFYELYNDTINFIFYPNAFRYFLSHNSCTYNAQRNSFGSFGYPCNRNDNLEEIIKNHMNSIKNSYTVFSAIENIIKK